MTVMTENRRPETLESALPLFEVRRAARTMLRDTGLPFIPPEAQAATMRKLAEAAQRALTALEDPSEDLRWVLAQPNILIKAERTAGDTPSDAEARVEEIVAREYGEGEL